MPVRVIRFFDRIIEILALGEAIPRLWVLYLATGGVSFGMLSYSSKGAAVILIPLFILSGLFNFYGCWVCGRKPTGFETGRKSVIIGASIMMLASWTRGILIWGLPQTGLGSSILASIVWMWITVGATFLLIAIWQRGLR